MKLSTRLKLIADSLRLAMGDDELKVGDDFYKLITKLCYVRDDINGKIPISDIKEVTPNTTDTLLNGGVYLENDVTIKGDSNLNPSNILRGKSIFGVKGQVNTVRQFVGDLNTSKYYGEMVADVARSYHLARINGTDFKYNQSHGILRDGILTDNEGACYLDCSGFISLVLRGIPFNKSPFYKVQGQPNKTLSSIKLKDSFIYDMACDSSYSWANVLLDKQIDSGLKDIGLEGFKSISNAGQLGEYFFGQGRALYVFEKSPETVPSNLQPGDLIFWSKSTASTNQKNRFMGISHVGVVARDTTRFIHVTGSDEEKGDTVFYSEIATKLDEISLIVRPNYQPVIPSLPLNENLLPLWGYDNCNVASDYTTKGVKFKPVIEGGFSITRLEENTSSSTFYIKKSENPITLTKGSYKLSGAPVLDGASTSQSTRDWGLMIKALNGETILDSEGIEVLDKGKGSTFTLSEDKEVYIYFYCSSKLSPNGVICKPSLVKIS